MRDEPSLEDDYAAYCEIVREKGKTPMTWEQYKAEWTPADYDGPTDDQVMNGFGMEGGVRYAR